MKILIIANASQWASWPQKIANIKAFFAPLVNLQIDIKYTEKQNIPLAMYQGINTSFGTTGIKDVAGSNYEIERSWFDANIVPFIVGYDIAVFQTSNLLATGLPLGIRSRSIKGTWCVETFVRGETYNYYLPLMLNLGNLAEVIIEHEICHALYSITGQRDRTHEFFYSNTFPQVLADIKLPSAIIKPMETSVGPSQLEQFCLAIRDYEGGRMMPTIVTTTPETADLTPPAIF